MNKQTQPMTREAEPTQEQQATEQDILEQAKYYWDNPNMPMSIDVFLTLLRRGITETNSKWKQAIQKTLKELKEKTYKMKGNPYEIEIGVYDKLISAIEMKEIIDTTFKKYFGGLAE